MRVLSLFITSVCACEAQSLSRELLWERARINQMQSHRQFLQLSALGQAHELVADSSAMKALSSLFLACRPSISNSARLLPSSFSARPSALICDMNCIDGKCLRASTPLMQFGNPFDGLKNPFKDKRDGATTLILGLSFRVSDRGPKSLLGQIEDLAAAADTSTQEGIAELCGDTALLLLRRSDEWISAYGSAQHKDDYDEALLGYDRMALNEAAKFEDRDLAQRTDAALISAGLQKTSGASTLAVVTIVACIAGDSEKELQTSYQGGATAMKTAFQELAALAQDADNVLAFELFWVPADDKEVLDSEEILLDWPELMTL